MLSPIIVTVTSILNRKCLDFIFLCWWRISDVSNILMFGLDFDCTCEFIVKSELKVDRPYCQPRLPCQVDSRVRSDLTPVFCDIYVLAFT